MKNYESMTIAQLKNEWNNRGIGHYASYGLKRKADFCQALIRDDAARNMSDEELLAMIAARK